MQYFYHSQFPAFIKFPLENLFYPGEVLKILITVLQIPFSRITYITVRIYYFCATIKTKTIEY